jgi:hypothetical protein
VRVAEAPLSAVVPTFTQMGASENFAELFRDIHAGLDTGRIAWEGGQVEFVRSHVSLKLALQALLAKA